MPRGWSRGASLSTSPNVVTPARRGPSCSGQASGAHRWLHHDGQQTPLAVNLGPEHYELVRARAPPTAFGFGSAENDAIRLR